MPIAKRINNLQAKLAEANQKEIAEQSAIGLETSEMQLTTLNDLKFKPEALLELVGLVDNKTISSSAAQQVFQQATQCRGSDNRNARHDRLRLRRPCFSRQIRPQSV